MEKKTITVTIFNEQYNLTTELPKKKPKPLRKWLIKKCSSLLKKLMW